MTDGETLAIGGISAGATVAVHEWLHASDVTQDIPNLTGTTAANVGSVSVGLAVAVILGVLINYWYWTEVSE